MHILLATKNQRSRKINNVLSLWLDSILVKRKVPLYVKVLLINLQKIKHQNKLNLFFKTIMCM